MTSSSERTMRLQPAPATSRARSHTPAPAHRPLARAVSPSVAVGSKPSALPPLQRLAGNAAVARLMAARTVTQRIAEDAEDAAAATEVTRSPVLDVIGHGGGTPLDPQTRSTMEQGFGRDFSNVRIHSGSAAATSAASVQALAYTVGNEIVMPGGVRSSDPASMHVLAHELTHVTQQNAGPVDGSPVAGGIQVSDPGDRFEQEAERTAARVMSGLAGRR